MDEELQEEEEVLLFYFLRRRRRGQKLKKKRKKPRLWVRVTGNRELYFRCVYILFILAGYLSRTLILVSCQLVAVE